MPEIGDRRTVYGDDATAVEVYRPDAVPWRAGLLRFAGDRLGKPSRDPGWVVVWHDRSYWSYPVVVGDRICGGEASCRN